MTNRSIIYSSFFALVLAFRFSPCEFAAAPLADHVPEDAVLYVGWAGADSLASAYQGSDLGAFIDHSNLTDLAKQFLPQLVEHLGARPTEAENVAAFKKALPLLWKHPVTFYASNVTIKEDGSPDINFALTCDAGPDAAELEADLQAVISHSNLRVVTHNSVITVGQTRFADAELGATLAGNSAFIAAMQKLQPSPALAVYVDAKTILAKADESALSNDTAADVWPKVRDALGIAGVKSFAMTEGFDGSNWMTTAMLQAPSPRTGLLAAFEPTPIDPALLARIPATAGSVSVVNFDLAKFVDAIGAAMAVNEQSDKAFHRANGGLTVVLGANFRKQIVGPLGPQWVLYSDSQLHSVVVMNHPNDPAAANDSMVSAIFGLTNLANAQIPGAATQPVVNAVQATVKKVNVTSAVTKYVSPSVAVNDGILYFGLSPESVVTSATVPATPTATDLMHSDNFLAAVKRLGVPTFESFQYCDLPNTAPLAYDNFAAAGSQLRQLLSPLGVEIPKIELPPLDQLKTHLSPALAVRWADADGIYSKSISPFPFSTRLLGDPQQMIVGATTVQAISAAVMPIVQKQRARAASFQAMSQERQILMGMIMYSTAHKGQFPPDLGTLVSNGEIPGSSLSIFLDPAGKTTVPPEIANGTKEQQAAWVNANTDYTLLAAGKQITDLGNANEAAVLVPKDAENAKVRVPVGFADGHVETSTPKHVHLLLHPDN